MSFTVNDGLFDSDPALACVALEEVNDAPVLTLGPDGMFDVMANYTEGQPEPLILAPDLEITGQPLVNHWGAQWYIHIVYICTQSEIYAAIC